MRARGLAGYDVALTWRRSGVRISSSPFSSSLSLQKGGSRRYGTDCGESHVSGRFFGSLVRSPLVSAGLHRYERISQISFVSCTNTWSGVISLLKSKIKPQLRAICFLSVLGLFLKIEWRPGTKLKKPDEFYLHELYNLYTRRFNKNLRCTGSAGDACLNIALRSRWHQ